MSTPYLPAQPERSEIDATPGVLVLDFGTDWCGHCRAAAPLIEQALAAMPEARHIKVEDGSGRKLGRSFKVKLWPTVVVIKDGKEVARVVRPDVVAELRKALEA
ncbi:thioredoxin family protein [Massilia genomosp. 1]|uniref:Thioredoxin n=1 Tax=Massilia genomosp. 1 TaxID=2609280 RepID=A0ABX0MJK4_9BURK|nr:thioredoxin family protein [Massilia genomosp. 1]NHZ62972.1 thioredoxin [Massilia genomosp. 1]